MIVQNGPVLCKCGNTARYINERGELCCSLCPLGEHLDAIRVGDVPKLLAFVRAHIENGPTSVWATDLKPALLDIIGRKP